MKADLAQGMMAFAGLVLRSQENELRPGALALRMCIFCEHNTDNNTNLKNANLWAINSLLYPRQLLVFHIYL